MISPSLRNVRQLRLLRTLRTYVHCLDPIRAHARSMLEHCPEHHDAAPFRLPHRVSAAFRALSERALASSLVGWYSA